jgi:hypothetical protein
MKLQCIAQALALWNKDLPGDGHSSLIKRRVPILNLSYASVWSGKHGTGVVCTLLPANAMGFGRLAKAGKQVLG